jgi:hypothetical protein
MKWHDVTKLRSGAVVGRFTRRGVLISVLIVLERPRRDSNFGELLRARCFDLVAAELRMTDQHELADCDRVDGRH